MRGESPLYPKPIEMKTVTLTIKIDIQHEDKQASVLDLAKISGKAVNALTDEAKANGFKVNNLLVTDK